MKMSIMNKINVCLLLIFAVLALSIISCDDGNNDNGDNGNDVPIIDDEKKSLLGTSWKLVGLVDENGTLREFEPTDCGRCYTVTFDSVTIPYSTPWPNSLCTDMTFSGHSHANRVYGTYCANYVTHEFLITNYERTVVGSIYDEEELWHNIIRATTSFSLHEDELKLNYDGNKYMLFESHVVCKGDDCDANDTPIIECEGEIYTAPFYVFDEERSECGYLLFSDFGSPHLFHGSFIWTGDFDLPEEFRERYLPVMVTFCETEKWCASSPVVNIVNIKLNIKEDSEQ